MYYFPINPLIAVCYSVDIACTFDLHQFLWCKLHILLLLNVFQHHRPRPGIWSFCLLRNSAPSHPWSAYISSITWSVIYHQFWWSFFLYVNVLSSFACVYFLVYWVYPQTCFICRVCLRFLSRAFFHWRKEFYFCRILLVSCFFLMIRVSESYSKTCTVLLWPYKILVVFLWVFVLNVLCIAPQNI